MSGVLAGTTLWLGILSAVTLLLGIAGGLLALVTIPGNYFSTHRKKPKRAAQRPTWQRIALRIAKNIAGAALLVLGIIMTLPLVPGPGIVFLLLGLSLVDIPGKRRFQRYLISKPMVLRPINKLRARCHRPALVTS